MPETSIIHFVAYPADTLYILTENDRKQWLAQNGASYRSSVTLGKS
jgi:hypothetical protein